MGLGKNTPSSCILHGLGYLTLALCLGGWTAALVTKATSGEFTPPLDDTFIYLQYARGAAQGEPLAYQPGAAPTRGATSLLYPLLLAPAARGLGPQGLIWAAWALGVLTLAGSALAADRWAIRRAGPGAGAAAGLLVLASGHFLWGTTSGMDIGIYALAVTGTLALIPWYLEEPDRRSGIRRLGVLSAGLLLLGWARPEGLWLAFLMAGGVILAGRAPNSRRARAVLLLAPLAAASTTLAVNLLATGDPGGNTLAAKSVWTEPRPDVRANLVDSLPWVFLQITRALFSDFRSRAYDHGTGLALEGLWFAGALIAAGIAFTPRRGGAAERILVLTVLAALLAGLIPAGFRSHHYRYQIPYIPLAVLLFVYGSWGLLGRRPRLAWMSTLVLLFLLLPGLWRFGRIQALNAANIHDQQAAAGRWIAANLPDSAIVALNDAGAIAYYGGRQVLDLVGLVTNGPARPHRSGPGSLYEWLEDLPPEERPTHFAIFPDWFPYFTRTSLLDRKLAQFTLGRNTISGGDVKSIYTANWAHVGLSRRLWVRRDLVDLWGFRVVDELDVAGLAGEAAHEYESFDSSKDSLREFAVEGDPGRLLIEGGRQPSRGERFRLRCRPGEPAVLVMRTEAYREFDLEVRVNGRELGLWSIPRLPVTWSEPMFQIPPDALTGETVRIELVQALGDDTRYPSFHYWLLQ